VKNEIMKMLSNSRLSSVDIKEKLQSHYPGVDHKILNESIHRELEELTEERKLFFDFKSDSWCTR